MQNIVSAIYREKLQEIQSRVPVKIAGAGFKRALENAVAGSGAAETPVKYTEYGDLIRAAAEKYGIDEKIIEAVINVESGFNPNAVSRAGAMGLMQLMPKTAASLGVSDPFDPGQNIEGGTKYLYRLLNIYDGDLITALAAYNCGPGALNRLGIDRIQTEEDMAALFKETRNYVNKVIKNLNKQTGGLYAVDFQQT